MANNPRKSTAFLITFIIVLILLVIGFLLFRNSDKIFGTKSTEEGGGKSFMSLFGTDKPKDLTTVDNNTPGGDTPTTNNGANGGTTDGGTGGTQNTDTPPPVDSGFGSGNFGNDSGFGTGGFGNGEGLGITPPLDPITPPEDRDNNRFTDTPTPDRNPRPLPAVTVVEAYCPKDDPLEFTDAEREELEALLKEYYAISHLLKTEDDIALLESDIKTNQDLVAQVESLNAQCEVQKSDYRYTGPQTIKSNPYYTNTINSITPYVPTYEILEDLFKVW